MLQLFKILDANLPGKPNEVLAINKANKTLVNYFCIKPKYRVLESIQNAEEFEPAMLNLIMYIAYLNTRRIAHLDIKPINIFIGF